MANGLPLFGGPEIRSRHNSCLALARPGAAPFGAVLPSPWHAVARSGPTQSSCGHADEAASFIRSLAHARALEARARLSSWCQVVDPGDPCSHDSFVPSQAGCRARAVQCRGWHPAPCWLILLTRHRRANPAGLTEVYKWLPPRCPLSTFGGCWYKWPAGADGKRSANTCSWSNTHVAAASGACSGLDLMQLFGLSGLEEWNREAPPQVFPRAKIRLVPDMHDNCIAVGDYHPDGDKKNKKMRGARRGKIASLHGTQHHDSTTAVPEYR